MLEDIPVPRRHRPFSASSSQHAVVPRVKREREDSEEDELDEDVKPDITSKTMTKTKTITNSKHKSDLGAKPKRAKTKATTTDDEDDTKVFRTPRRWTASDLEALFTAAIGDGPSMRMFEGRVPGRTPKQCHDTWR
jgi:hypothetical protein